MADKHGKFWLDWGESTTPKFKEDYMTFDFLGEFHSTRNHKLPKVQKKQFLDPQVGKDNDVAQFLIYDKMPTSLLWAMYDRKFFSFDSSNPDHKLLNMALGDTTEDLLCTDLEDWFPEVARDYGSSGAQIKLAAYEHPDLKIRPGWAGNLVITMPTRMQVMVDIGPKDGRSMARSYMRVLEMEANLEIMVDIATSGDKFYFGVVGTSFENATLPQDNLGVADRIDQVIEDLNNRLLLFARTLDEEYFHEGYQLPPVFKHLIIDFHFLEDAILAELQMDYW